MPSGFENSAMKSSFSLSSLPPSSATLESPEHVRLNDRPYSSLRKKPRRDPENESWRRSWGSREENKDEFWAALKNNYQYLMDNNLIDSCKEARQDLQYGASPTHEWSFEQFTEQFTELDAWLSNIQDAVYSKEENVIDRNLRLSHMEEMQRKSYKRKLFNNQSGRLVARMPKLKNEVAWRVSYLNSKWERLEQTVTPRKRAHPDHPDIDVENELRCLRKWIKETEKRLQPLNCHEQWTLQELEVRAKEYEVVERDVWSHAKIVNSVVKLCERLNWAEDQQASIVSWVRGRRCEPSRAASSARSLQRRWQYLYISTLECQCHIEQLTNALKQKQGSPLSAASVDSDEEPLTKHRKLCDTPSSSQEQLCLLQGSDQNDVLMEAEDVLEMEVEAATPEKICSPSARTYHQEKVIVLHNTESMREILLNEASKFDRPDRTAPNLATFYFRHSDTETEQECTLPADLKSLDDTSEEEWTYRCTDEMSKESVSQSPACPGSPSKEETTEKFDVAVQAEVSDLEETAKSDLEKQRPRKDVIERLVNQAEELVREEVMSSPARKAARVSKPHLITDHTNKAKNTRIVEWLELQDPDEKTVGDSCDASGEYTTEDDDAEVRTEDMSIGSTQDLNATVVAADERDSPPQTPDHSKVVLRAKKREMSVQRPWSVSGAMSGSLTNLDKSQLAHSVSESAIHKMSPTSTPCKMDSSIHTGSTLSSSTVEDTAQTQEGSGGGYSSNSLRRRKVKLRKRNLGRKSESGSEGVLGNSDSSHPTMISSKVTALLRRPSVEKAVSDSPHRRYIPTFEGPSSSSNTDSECESEDSVKMRRKPMAAPDFKIGPTYTVCSYAQKERKENPVSNDSSFSEQAWDNYQEKYMSEAYSEEPPDAEASRRLLEFGDDYRTFFDSQSDCASSLGHPPVNRRRRSYKRGESDSDLDDIRDFVKQSVRHYKFSEQLLNRELSRKTPILVLTTDIMELIATCGENVMCLAALLEKLEKLAPLLSTEECNEISGLIENWKSLEKSAKGLLTTRSLQREMAALRNDLKDIDTRLPLEANLEERDQLEIKLREVKRGLNSLKELKTAINLVNIDVHRFVTDSGAADISLKNEVSALFASWVDINDKYENNLYKLQEAGAAWQQLESHLAGFQVALRGDHETLKIIDLALQGGPPSADLVTSVRDLAKVLSEKQEILSTTTVTQGVESVRGLERGGMEGSLSDSGISDSGSEQDLSERERRLAALRKLLRRLETILAPGSTAIVNMAKRIEQTESELRGLQRTCRDLIVRTAVSAENKTGPIRNQPLSSSPTFLPWNKDSTKGKKGKAEEEESDEGKGGWLWRVLRAAFPFQLAILALFWVACFLEPHCCDSINKLNFSFTPHLRYVGGSPPI